MQQNQYDKEPLTAVEAQRLAQEIAFGPIVFQVSRLTVSYTHLTLPTILLV